MAETFSGRGPRLRDATAGLAMLAAATGASAETAQKIDGTAADTAAQITDCVADGKAYRKEWLMERAETEGVTRSKLKEWLGRIMGTDDFKGAMNERFDACDRANDEIRLAQLDARIALAQTVFVENGYEMRTDEDDQVALYREDRLAAYIVQVVEEDAETDPATGLQPTRWGLDFAPLEAWNAELIAETESLRAEREAIRQQMEDIWKEIETRALDGDKTAELSDDIARPPIQTAEAGG